MLKLKLLIVNQDGTPHSSPEYDADINPKDIRNITHAELKLRGEGLGGGFKGRAPNRVIVSMNDERYNAIALPDDFSLQQKELKEVTLYDSKKPDEDPLFFELATNSSRKWLANQPTPEEVRTGENRQKALISDFKKKFPWIGDVGVNDLGYLLNMVVEVPANLAADENNIVKLRDFGDELQSQYKTSIAVNIKEIGERHYERKPVVGAGHVGETSFPEVAMAGRMQIEAEGYSNPGLGDLGMNIQGIRNENEEPLVPGQNAQDYGSPGPQD